MRDIFLRPKKQLDKSQLGVEPQSNHETFQDLVKDKSDDFFSVDLHNKTHSSSKKQSQQTLKPTEYHPKKTWLIVIIIILILVISCLVYGYYVIMIPISQNSTQNIAIDISDGESTFEIADQLKDKNLIRSPWFFTSYVKYKKALLLPGIYYLQQNMNFEKIIERISSGDVQEYKITIPEGWRITQIAQYLTDKKMVKYNDFVEIAKDKEGYLFPDTYQISIDATANDIIKTMQDNFNTRTAGLGLTNDKLILASIVEREAKNDSERAKIAGVYQNRLDNNMKLEADPTVQYAKGDWDAPTVSDYTKVESPYNTYLYKGLPPGPISNPGLASINAVMNPEKHDYFYFFHSNGDTIFSKTKEEHDANKAKYLNN